MSYRTARADAIDLVRSHLLRREVPRIQVSLLLIVTAGLGFLASVSMLRLGLVSMALRYPVAVVLAYAAFVALLRLWLGWYRRRETLHLDLGLDLDLSRLDFSSGGGGEPFGGGGGFGGGGAGGSWSSGPAVQEPVQVAFVSPRASGSPGGSGGKGWGFGLDLGDGSILLVPILAALAAALASLYVVYAAPSLLAELLVDGLVVTALYRRIRGVEHRNWLRAVLRRTWIPAVLTAVVFSVAGHLMQRAYPDAPSIGPFWQAATQERSASQPSPHGSA
jgi:hypothetical protein